MEKEVHSIPLSQLVEEFGFTVANASRHYDETMICSDDVNRCGLQLAVLRFFDNERIQMIGMVETTFLEHFTSERRRNSFEKLFATKIPALLITRV